MQVEEEGLSHKDFASNCGTVAAPVMAMIDEDFVVLNSGVFRKVTGVFKALHELYLEKFSDEMSLLVDEIGDEVAKSAHRPFTQSKSEHGLHKNNVVGSSRSKDASHRNSVGGISAAPFCLQSLLRLWKRFQKDEGKGCVGVCVCVSLCAIHRNSVRGMSAPFCLQSL